MTKKNDININMSWDKQVVPSKSNSERSLLIDIKANTEEEKTTKKRPPVNLALVIDRSGSMDGSPINAAKSAVIQIAEKLSSKDRLSLVSFDYEVDTHFINMKMDDKGKSDAKALVSEIYARGSTDLAGGWFEGARCATRAIDEGEFKDGYVVILSDGRANRGIQDPIDLKVHASELSTRGIQTTSVGIGEYYSPLQLDALAEGGLGRLHHTDTAEDIVDVILGELGEIGSTIAKNIKLNIHHPQHVELKCLSKMENQKLGNAYQIKVGNLQQNQTKSVALLSVFNRFDIGTDLSFEAHICWDDVKTGKHRESPVINSSLKVVSSKEAKEATINTAVVQKIADLWEASMAYESMILNEQNRFDKASSIFDDNMTSYSLCVDSLIDSEDRIDRLLSTQNKVSSPWVGRTKRASYNLSKKMMMSEKDLRHKDAGDWHGQF